LASVDQKPRFRKAAGLVSLHLKLRVEIPLPIATAASQSHVRQEDWLFRHFHH